MELYRTRFEEVTDQERRILTKKNIVEMLSEVETKEKHSFVKSKFFGWTNTILNLTVVLSSAVITIVTSIYDTQNIPAIVLGGLIFAISGANELLNLGSRGFFYRQGTLRLRRIRQQLNDIMTLYNNFSCHEILAFLNSFRTEIDEIDLDLYRSSVSGDAKFGNELSIQASEFSRTGGDSPARNLQNRTNTPEPLESPSHIHIHIDSLDREEVSQRTPSSSRKPSPSRPKINETPEDPPSLLEVSKPHKKKSSSSKFFERNEDVIINL